jgi:transcriptional regulator with XRE-family HTH domain
MWQQTADLVASKGQPQARMTDTAPSLRADHESKTNAPTPSQIPPGAITAIIGSEDQFLAALRARREELGLSYETLEAICGLSDRKAAKLFSGQRPIGALYLWLILEALGLRIRLEVNPEAVARMSRRSDWETGRARPKRKWGLSEIAIARRRNAPWLWDSERARAAALMRWHRPRIDEIAG